MYRTPIFIQAGLGKNAQPLNELLSRWELYGKTLEQLTQGNQTKIIVFLPKSSEVLNLNHLRNLEIRFFSDSLIGRLRLVIHLSKYINRLANRKVTLVAGDLYISPILSNLAKFLCDGSVKLQVQFHGASYNKRGNGFSSLLRYFLVRLAIHLSDSIRIVSPFQQNDIHRLSSRINNEFVIAPIPLSINKISIQRIPHLGLEILVLGRLHPERGINKLVELIDLLVHEETDCTINVVGEGQQADLLTTYIDNPNVFTKVVLHGLKNEMEVKDYLAKSDILISFAEEEGYGLALREAILSGVHVIARRNLGTEEVLAAFPGRIELFESVSEAIELITNFEPRIVDDDALTELRLIQERSNSKVVQDLVSSWILN